MQSSIGLQDKTVFLQQLTDIICIPESLHVMCAACIIHGMPCLRFIRVTSPLSHGSLVVKEIPTKIMMRLCSIIMQGCFLV